MRKTLLLLVIALVATTALGQQIRTPALSPGASLTQTVGVNDITIKYSRPGVKGRKIWGDLVPYGQVWRTGANAATTISFSDEVEINGQKLAAGTYSLHTLPAADQWTLYFNSGALTGGYNYDAAKNVLEVKVKPEPAEHREWLLFEIPEMTTDTAKIVLRWEKLAVPFTVDTKSTSRTMAKFQDAMAADWRTPMQAAAFALDNKGVATDQQVSDWLDKSLSAAENTNNLWVKARFLERQGKKAEAIKTAEAAVAKARPDQTGLVDFIKTNIESWKKK